MKLKVSYPKETVIIIENFQQEILLNKLCERIEELVEKLNGGISTDDCISSLAPAPTTVVVPTETRPRSNVLRGGEVVYSLCKTEYLKRVNKVDCLKKDVGLFMFGDSVSDPSVAAANMPNLQRMSYTRLVDIANRTKIPLETLLESLSSETMRDDRDGTPQGNFQKAMPGRPSGVK